MVDYTRTVLDNGLTVIVHEDKSSPMVAINVLYRVGSKDESPDKTGFTHLFEHLMFGGSKNIPDFDEPIQLAGGENNAFTNSDVTNFYNLLPAENWEVGLWLEADRMTRLNLNQTVLDTQKKVVIEEFKETCLNEPYGDLWHHLSSLNYDAHPYRWPTIGKEIDHIEKANMQDVETFYQKWYRPNNAVLCVTGHVDKDDVLKKVNEYFGDLEYKEIDRPMLEEDPRYLGYRSKELDANVPLRSVVLSFKMQDRMHEDFYVTDLLSDLLANGKSARLYKYLVRQKPIFSHLDAFISGVRDRGLLIIEGKPSDGVSTQDAVTAIWNELDKLKSEKIEQYELDKMINKAESHIIFSESSILNKAMSLAYFEYIGDLDLINKEVDRYKAVTAEDIIRVSNELFIKDNCSEIIYRPI